MWSHDGKRSWKEQHSTHSTTTILEVSLVLRNDSKQSQNFVLKKYVLLWTVIYQFVFVVHRGRNKGLLLIVQLGSFENAFWKIVSIPWLRGSTLRINDIWSKNKGLGQLADINEVILHGIKSNPLTIVISSAYIYAPFVFVDAECSLLQGIQINFSDRRLDFKQENIEKHLVEQYNAKYLK